MNCYYCIFEKVSNLFKSMFSKEDKIDSIFIDIDNEVIK